MIRYLINLFKRKPIVFITIEFDYIPGIMDYPKHLPLPTIGSEVIFDGNWGKVNKIKHITHGSITTVRINCAKMF